MSMITALIPGVWIMRVKRVMVVEDVNTGEKKPLSFSLNQAGIFPVILVSTLLMLPLQFKVLFNFNGTSLNNFINILYCTQIKFNMGRSADYIFCVIKCNNV